MTLTKTILCVAAVALSAAPLAAVAGLETEGSTVRATVELSDGSRLVGTPVRDKLLVNMEFTKADVPLVKVATCELRPKDERIVLTMVNGDKITGLLETAEFPLETILGTLSPPFAQIERMSFSAQAKGGLPAGDGSIAFGGVNWTAWRTSFEVQGDKLVSLPKARPGFNYGHSGNGRDASLLTNIGSREWRDYSVEVEMCLGHVNPAFNPHGLPGDFRGGRICFHVVTMQESWNEAPGTSAYMFNIDGDGNWSIVCCYGAYCKQEIGFGGNVSHGGRTLATGKGLKLDSTNGNKYRIDVCGDRIQVWVDGEKIADVRDEKMGEAVEGVTLDHGGVGFQWGFESMGWIRNFSAKRL